MNLHQFMCDPLLTAGQFDAPSWRVHREVLAHLWDGEAHRIPEDLIPVAQKLTGCEELPTAPPDELYLGFGRRSGKTRFLGAAAVFAWAQDYRELLAPGEWATISCHCVDKRQARTLFGYAQGLIESSSMLDAEKENVTAEAIESKHRTRIEIHSSSYRSIRGYSLALAILDEAAFLRDEQSASPDKELYRSLLPALATLHGRLIVASSLHRKTGLMWEKHRKHYGRAMEAA